MPNDASVSAYKAMGFPFAVITNGSWEFPMTASVVIDRAGLVRFADVVPDWLRRTEPEPIFDAVREVVAGRPPARD
jgi:hypothetical protein